MNKLWQLACALVLGTAAVSSADTPINLKVEDVSGSRGDTIIVAIRITSAPLTQADTIRSYQFHLAYDSAKVKPIVRDMTGTLIKSVTTWPSVADNIDTLRTDPTIPRVVKMAVASSDVMTGGDPIAKVKFKVVGARGDTTLLVLSEVLFLENPSLTGTLSPGKITVVNALPVLNPIGNKTFRVGTLLSFTLTSSDADGDMPTYSATGLPPGATLDPSTGVFSWTPALGAAASYTVTFTVDDGHGGTKSETITISDINRAPVLVDPGAKTVAEGVLLTFVISATDPDGDVLTYTTSTLPTGATFNAATRTFSWTPGFDQAGKYPVTFTVSDAYGGTASKEITITVTDVNRAPSLADPGPKTILEDAVLAFTLSASDPDGDAITFSISGAPSGATFNTTTGAFSWKPSFTQAGAYLLRFTAADPKGGTATREVSVTVNDNNRPPALADPGAKSVKEDSLLTFTLSATDPDGDAITYSISGAPTGATFDTTKGVFSWKPTFAQQGTYNVTFTAKDRKGGAGSKTVTITVVNVNHLPTITPQFAGPITIPENSLFTMTATAADPDVGDTLTLSGTITPTSAASPTVTGFTFTKSGNVITFSWTPGFDVSTPTRMGSYNVAFTVNDGKQGTATAIVQLNVINTNRAPTMQTIPAQRVTKGRTLTVPVKASDVDGDSLYLKVAPMPAGASISGLTFVWPTKASDVGQRTLTFTVWDRLVLLRPAKEADTPLSVSQQVQITVVDTNYTPVLQPIPAISVEVGKTAQVQVRATDADGDSITYSITFVTGVAKFGIDPKTGVISYTPVLADTGSYVATITATDTKGASASQQVTVTVTKDRTPPYIIGQPAAQGITTNQATITWKTNEPANSVVRYGLVGGAMTEKRDPTLVLDHSVILTSLEAGRTYAYEVQSFDDVENPSVVLSSSFTTLQPQVIVPPLTITVRPSVERGTNSAIVTWETNRFSSSVVRYSTLKASLADSATGASGTSHSVTIANLTPSTLYFYRARSVDASDSLAVSAIDSFSTKAELKAPVITTPPAVVSRTSDAFSVRWVTDRASTSRLEFGITTAYGQLLLDTTAVTIHAMTVTGLQASTKYNFRVGSKGPEGLGPTFSANQEVFTTAAPDTLRPIITEGPSALNPDYESVTITWTTDEAANSIVSYGIVQPDGSVQFGTPILRSTYEKMHRVPLTGLDANTTYRYQVASFDIVGNGPTQATDEFTTAAAPDVTPPVLLGKVLIGGITDRSASVRWITDEPSDSKVIFQTAAGVRDEVSSASLVTDHSMALTGLSPVTNYSLSIYSRDAAGNLLGPIATSFRTNATPDTLPPVITAAPKIDAQTLTEFNLVNAVLSVSTDELATTSAAYGLSPDSLIGYVPPSELGKTQRLQFTNLPPDTTIYYRLTFTDAAEVPNTRVDILRSFRTIAGRDVTPPRITVGPTIVDVQPHSVTVEWTTDEAATSSFRLGTVATDLNILVHDPTPVLKHRLTATNLTSGTHYYWRVRSIDPSNNEVVSAKYEVTTSTEADTVPPVFTDMPVVRWTSDSLATMEWKTDENTIGDVYIATTTDTLYNIVSDEVFKTGHNVTLVNLEPGTEYVYFVGATDASGNIAVAGDSTAPVFDGRGAFLKLAGGWARLAQPARGGLFTTAVAADVTNPAITGAPKILGTSTATATIGWSTDEVSNSVVRFMESSEGGGKLARTGDIRADLIARGRVVTQTENVTAHQVTVTQLKAGTRYVLHVASTDPAGNGETISDVVYVNTPQEADLTPPAIVEGSIQTFQTQTQAVVRWETDELSDSRVDYGDRADSLKLSRVVPDPTQNHQVVLTNLTPDKTYFFKVFSTDARGNGPTASAVASFKTPKEADTTPPVVDSMRVARIADKTATLAWQTDEPANTFIEFGLTKAYGRTSVDPTPVISHSVTLTNLLPSTQYYYRVAATDRVGNTSALTSADSLLTSAAPDTIGPDAPAKVDTIPASNRVILRWAKSASPDLASYILYRNGVVLASGIADTSYQDRTAANNTTYTYEIAGVDLANNVGAKTAPVRETPLATEAPGAPTPVTPKGGTPIVPTLTITVQNAIRAVSRPDVPLTYSFVVASDSLLQNVLATSAGVTEGATTTSWTVSGTQFEKDGVYYWASQATGAVTSGPLSPSTKFVWGGPVGVELETFAAAGLPNGVVRIIWSLRVDGSALSEVVLARGADGATTVKSFGSDGASGDVLDMMALPGTAPLYWLRVTDHAGATKTFGPVQANLLLPTAWAFSPARPNPFNPTTEVTLAVPSLDVARVMVYNVLGQPVATLWSGPITPGIHRLRWDGMDMEGREVASGVYLIRLETAHGITRIQRVTMLR